MITARNLTKRFGDRVAFDNVSFEMEEGAVCGLVGSNGSGKSTLLRLISGVYRADSGSIGIDGIETFDHPMLKSKIAFLGDTPYFLPQSTLAEMSRFYSSLYPNFNAETFRQLQSVFPLDARKRLTAMSKGQQRQAALMLLLATEPQYLLMDEAFDGLDVVMRRVLANLIMDGVENRGMTTVIASHNLRELEDLCDHVALIHDGKMLFNDETERLKGGLHKVQAAFRGVPEESAFDGLNVLKCDRTGSLLQMVIRGDEEEILEYFKRFDPVFLESVAPSLEEMFVYELEVTGYDVKNILH
ncbi:MAG: ABC transporter ATP-binding protein [Clostridia bacterium]|nr:ABC transporter ATP-binding protein [Clostridia bacterium]